MNSATKKIIIVSGFSAIPLIIFVVENFVAHRRGWGTVPEVQYAVITWLVRLLLTPAIIFYTLKLWTELNRWFKTLLVHIAGFISYSIILWTLSFIILHKTLPGGSINGNSDLVNTMIGRSLVLNLLIYVSTVGLFYVWEYFEKNVAAEEKAITLEKYLAVTPGPSKSAVDHLTIKNGTKTIVIALNEVDYFMADGSYIQIVMNDHVYVIKKALYKFQNTLPDDLFIRVHRSCIVNVNCVKEIRSLLNGDYTIILKNDAKIRASRTYRENLKKVFGKI